MPLKHNFVSLIQADAWPVDVRSIITILAQKYSKKSWKDMEKEQYDVCSIVYFFSSPLKTLLRSRHENATLNFCWMSRLIYKGDFF